MRSLLRVIFLLVFLCTFAACSAVRPVDPEVAWDPIEPVNRGVFWFNDKVDVYLIEPASDVYDYVLPDFVQDKVGNFFVNLKAPVRIVNAALQLEGTQAMQQFGRFLINTTAGLGGLFDVAEEWGVPEHEEDLGVTLASYGVPAGPYIVLPFLGPSNLRDAFGRAGDSFLDPVFWVGSSIDHDQTQLAVTGGAKALEILQTRYELDPGIETSRKSSLDRYLFIQSAYYQYRNGRIHNGANVASPYDPDYGSGVEGTGGQEKDDISFD